MVVTLALAAWEWQLHPMPLWRSPFVWPWIAAPFLGWMLADHLSRARNSPAGVLFLGSLVSCLGGLATLLGDTLRSHVPGGMNPAAVSGSGPTFLAVPLLQWLVLAPCIAIAWFPKAPPGGLTVR